MIGNECEITSTGHKGKITQEIDGFWFIRWYSGNDGKEHTERFKKGTPPSWISKEEKELKIYCDA